MFRTPDYLGVPSWLRRLSLSFDPTTTMEKFEIADILARIKSQAYLLETQSVLVQWTNKLKISGKKFFQMKDYGQARDMYLCAQVLSQQVSFDVLPQHERSLHCSNLALCFLKLDCPFECLGNCELALKANPDNTKALYHGATAFYMVYNFEKASIFVDRGRFLNPESKDFEILQKKISSNKISSTYSLYLIQKRGHEYDSYFEAMVESPMVESISDQSKNVQLLIKSDTNNKKTTFIAVAKKMIEELVTLSEHCLRIKTYKRAYEIIVDMHHIIFILADKYKEILSVSYYDIFYKKALCLYYMEDYAEALKNCTFAKDFDENNINLMLLEARILYKKNQLEEALAISNKCLEAAKEHAPEIIIICEEILFAITFEMDQNKIQTTSLEMQKVYQNESGTVRTEAPSSPSISDKDEIIQADLKRSQTQQNDFTKNSNFVTNEALDRNHRTGNVMEAKKVVKCKSDLECPLELISNHEISVASTSGENRNASGNTIFNSNEIITPDVSDSFCSIS